MGMYRLQWNIYFYGKTCKWQRNFCHWCISRLEIEQMDVKTAFLYSLITEEIYVQKPHGFADGSPWVCKLRRALYGLKQSPRIWYHTLVEFLRGHGFRPINIDLSVFAKDGMVIAIYMDDLLLAGASKLQIQDTQ